MGYSRNCPKLLAKKLLAVREFLDVGQADMASRLQSEILSQSGRNYPIHPGRTSEYENGRREPNLFVLMAYARLAKLHLETLVDDDVRLEIFRKRLGKEFDYAKRSRRTKNKTNRPLNAKRMKTPPRSATRRFAFKGLLFH